jgi:general secretion pathway protein G
MIPAIAESHKLAMRPNPESRISNPEPMARSRIARGFKSIANPCAPRGFTLIEILVVVVILGILAMIVVPRVMEEPGRARVVRAKQDIASIVAALNIYKLDNFIYPSTEQGLEALVRKPTGQPDAPNWSQRLDRVPKDPWGHPYQYLQPGQHGDVDVYSFGADGKPGGEGEAADIGNWDS